MNLLLAVLGAMLPAFLGLLGNYVTHGYADPDGKKRPWVRFGFALTLLLCVLVAYLQQSGAITSPSQSPAPNSAPASGPASAPGPLPPESKQADAASQTTTDTHTPINNSVVPAQASHPGDPVSAGPQRGDETPTSASPHPGTQLPPAPSRPPANNASAGPASSGNVAPEAQGTILMQCGRNSFPIDITHTGFQPETIAALAQKFRQDSKLCMGMVTVIPKLRPPPMLGGKDIESDPELNVAEALSDRNRAHESAEFESSYKENIANETDPNLRLLDEAITLAAHGHRPASNYVISVLNGQNKIQR